MEEHLTIHNFGPIQDAEITVRDLTVFVGPQATGKSLSAQVLCFLRGIQGMVPPDARHLNALDATLCAFEWWFGNAPNFYVGVDTQLCWELAETAEKKVRKVWWDADAHISEDLKSQIELAGLGLSLLSIDTIYIPAGRVLHSFILPRYRFFRDVTAKWPGYVLAFYETLGATLEDLWEEQQEAQFESGPNFESSETRFIRERIEAIMRGRVNFGPDAVSLEIGKKQLRSMTIAAGQMEVWPFWAVVKRGLTPHAQVYLEEPEAHLHPGSQSDIMEIIAYLVNNRDTRFLLTTHSPYILYAVNNFLMAQKVLKAGKALPPDVPPEVALCPDQVAAYRFSSDGTVYDIMDTEVGLIDEDELDFVADELGATFTRLQEQLEGVV